MAINATLGFPAGTNLVSPHGIVGKKTNVNSNTSSSSSGSKHGFQLNNHWGAEDTFRRRRWLADFIDAFGVKTGRCRPTSEPALQPLHFVDANAVADLPGAGI